MSWTAAKHTRMFKKEVLLGCDFYKVSPQLADKFFSHISYSVEQVKNNFLSVREKEKDAFHFLIRSVFLEKPIIDFQDGSMIAPNPDLIFVYSGEGLLKLLSSIPHSDIYIARSFESYIGALLNCLSDKLKVIPSNQLEKITEGKSCDFLVETLSEIILVECKATTYTAKMFTDNAILNNNSTGKIADALVQLYTTAHDLDNGVFDSLGVRKNKPVVGLVVTFGELPLVNSKWYFKEFIMRRASPKLTAPIFPSAKMRSRPIVISVASFENLLTILNNTEINTLELAELKENKGYESVGDWNTFLSSKLKPEYEMLPILTENNKHFLKTCEL